MTEHFTWDYWYVFPCAVLVAVAANASGFSGAVLFQPFFNFVLRLPIQQSVATGIATEAIGMASGASRYSLMRKVDFAAARLVLPGVLLGVGVGVGVFVYAPRDLLRLVVGLVIGVIAARQLFLAARQRFGRRHHADLVELRRRRPLSVLAGAFSACTGTGVAEMHQPMLERSGGLATKRANATAIFVEAIADWTISGINLSMGHLRLDILLFSASGVLIGAQLGAVLSPYVSDRLLKTAFALCVLGIAVVYTATSVPHLASVLAR